MRTWTMLKDSVLIIFVFCCCAFYACSEKKDLKLNAKYAFRWEASGGARDDYYFYGPVAYYLLLQNNDKSEWSGVSIDVEIKNTYNGESRVINKSLAVIRPGERYSIPLAYLQGIPVRLDIRAKEGMMSVAGKNLLGGPDAPPAPVLEKSIYKSDLVKPVEQETKPRKPREIKREEPEEVESGVSSL